MGSVNKVILVGNLGADAEQRATAQGTTVVSFRMATTERYRDRDGQMRDDTEWHRVTLFGRVGEAIAQYLVKGKQIYLEGKLRTRQWDDKDGNKRYTTEVIGDRVVLLGGGSGGGSRAGADRQVSEPDVLVDDDIPF